MKVREASFDELGNVKKYHGYWDDFIKKFLASGKDCLAIECETYEEANRIYQSIYSRSVRRGYLKIRRFRRRNTIYIAREEE